MMAEQVAVLAGGCFWCTEAVFLDIAGVSKVESGYTGGFQDSPTYREVCGGNTGHAEAIKISTIATANAEAIQKVNQAIADGGELYLRYRQVEMLPLLVPMIADALAQAKLITVSGGEGGGAGGQTAAQIQSVIQTVLAAQLITKSGVLETNKSA